MIKPKLAKDIRGIYTEMQSCAFVPREDRCATVESEDAGRKAIARWIARAKFPTKLGDQDERGRGRDDGPRTTADFELDSVRAWNSILDLADHVE